MLGVGLKYIVFVLSNFPCPGFPPSPSSLRFTAEQLLSAYVGNLFFRYRWPLVKSESRGLVNIEGLFWLALSLAIYFRMYVQCTTPQHYSIASDLKEK